jgi:predicted NAD/FAD-binding protein
LKTHFTDRQGTHNPTIIATNRGEPLKVAIVGSGISGLGLAHALRGQAQLTLFEAGSYFGGHTNTVDLTLDGPQGPVTHGVDTGFLVFNERTYPRLIQLFSDLKVPTERSDMSFSVQVPGANGQAPLEWSGSSLNTVFAQRRNIANPRFLRMLRDVLRFQPPRHRYCEARRRGGDDAAAVRFFWMNTGCRLSSGIGISCPCWVVSGVVQPTRCCSSRWPP